MSTLNDELPQMEPQQHIIKLAKPNSEKQRVIMQSLVTPGVREIWVPCGTKFGKTFGAATAVCARAPLSSGGLIRWVAPIYSQSKIGYNYIRRMMPAEPIVKLNNAELSIKFNPSDTMIEIKSGRYPEDLEGEATSANVLDEVAKMSRQVYDSTKTTTTVTRGPILCISTPRGKNWFYTKCMEAKERMQWDLKRGKPPSIIFITAPSIDNPLVSPEAVADAKRGLPDRLFRQYYLAEFIDDGSVFSGYRDCVIGDLIETDDRSQRWFMPGYDTTKGQVVIGADWAKTKDWTVFIAIDVPTRRVVAFQRFHKTPYTEAVVRLVRFAKQFKDVIVINHDKTGLGGVIDDQLAYTDIPYNGITFTNQFKAEEVAKLITAFEQKLIQIPHWQHMLDELESYEVKATAVGNMTYAATTGKHDDIVSALMLAYSALSQYADAVYDIRFIDGNKVVDAYGSEVKDTQSPIERYYHDIVQMSDDD